MNCGASLWVSVETRPRKMFLKRPQKIFSAGFNRHISILEKVRAKKKLENSIDPNEQYKMPVLDKAATELFTLELGRGMWLVLEQMFKPPYTIMYPFEKGP